MVNQKDEERKKQVAHIIEIPAEYHLVVDDQTVNEPFHVLFWEHQDNNEKNIRISLNRYTGKLIELDIDDEAFFPSNNEEVEEETAKEIAHSFVKKYIPAEYEEYTYVDVKEWCGMQEVHYSQEVNGYPLPHTGCIVRIHPSGNVIAFCNRNGKKEKPVWPEVIVDKKQVLQQLKERQEMELVFAQLFPELDEYESGKEVNGYRLVYEPEPSSALVDACTGGNLFELEHYKLPSTVAISMPLNNKEQEKDIFRLLALEEKGFVKVSEDDCGNEIRMRFVPKEELQNKQEIKHTYLMDDFYKKHLPMSRYKNHVMIGIDKATNTLLHYFCSPSEREGKVILSREECLEKALQFLGHVIPNTAEYLRLWDNHDEEDSPGRFCFYVYINGIPVENSLVIINIDTEMGDVTMYSGISQSIIEELLTYETSAKIRKEQALETYRSALRVELQWHENHDTDTPKYELIYKQMTTEGSEEDQKDASVCRKIRYIDAHTGEIIWSK